MFMKFQSQPILPASEEPLRLWCHKAMGFYKDEQVLQACKAPVVCQNWISTNQLRFNINSRFSVF